jgi:predicted flap endonuclease-1-like 5' DNA nuclease
VEARPRPDTGEPVSAAKLDPAPFRETIDGVGDRIEPQLYRAGVRTYDALAKMSYEAFRRVLPTRTPVARELFESIQTQARDIASGARTWPEDDLRAWARDARRTLEQVQVQEGGS